MVCPECAAAELRSRVVEIGRSSTMMDCPAFHDEDGALHVHDGNVTTLEYDCTNGHRWRFVATPPRCPAQGCDWNRD